MAVPVDGEGIDVAAGTALAADARLAYVTPSHQYPLGMTLSLPRRLELIAWAIRSQAWILEDDYDSELRYAGQPLASMHGIDESGRVIYVGTFNKILFPAVRAAYLVLPQVLVEPFVRAKALADGFTSPFVQAVLADYIGEGQFAVHLRRVRKLYRERRDAFLTAAVDHLPPHAVLGPAEAGIHVALNLPNGIDDRRLSERALCEGLALPALSAQSIESAVRGLIVHYGHVPVPKLDSATRRLAGVLEHPRQCGIYSTNANHS